jgi:PKD repeat protein
MERRWPILLNSGCLFLALLGLSWSIRAETVFYGPVVVARDTAAPQQLRDSFTMADVEGDFTLVVHNGNVTTGADRVTSALVYVNGVTLFTPGDFGKQVDILEIPVTLQTANEITVEVRGGPGTYITVSVVGELWNRSPIAHAGPNINTLTATPVALDGSSSFDLDGDLITYRWVQVSAPAGSAAGLSDEQSAIPRFTPDIPGDYVFLLNVNDGQVDSEPSTVTVRAYDGSAPPNARAGRDQQVWVGTGVVLSGSDSYDPNGIGLDYQWSLVETPPASALTSDGIAPVSDSDIHFTPDVVGDYTLKLVVDNSFASDEDIVRVFADVPNVRPSANAGPDLAARSSDTVSFDGTGSSDSDGGPSPLSFSWSLVSQPPGGTLTSSDIQGAQSPLAQLAPGLEGSFVLRLDVSDGDLGDADNVALLIEDTPPSIQFRTPLDGTKVGTTTPTYDIQFDDGEGSGIDLGSFQLLVNGTDVTPKTAVSPWGATYTPTAPLPTGLSQALASVADLAGNVSTADTSFTISVFRAIADCGPQSGTAPHTVTYRTRGEFTEGSIVRYRWDRDGNGTYDTSDSVPRDYTWTFNSPGTYNARLEVLNNLGQTATDICAISVEREPPIASASAAPSNGPVPLTVVLTCSGQTKNGTITQWEWDFDGDGAYDSSSTTSGVVSHVYDAVGEYSARCRVTDSAGLTGVSGEINSTVRPRPVGSPTVTASASVTSGTAPVTVNFNGTVIDDGSITLYEWDFDGDGLYDYSSGVSPAASHVYLSGGIFAATLRVTDDAGLVSLDSIAIQVDVGASLSIPDDTFLPDLSESAIVRTTLSGGAPVRVYVRDSAGVIVRTLVDETRPSGTYEDHWDGRDGGGNLLPDGAYYAVLEYDVGGRTKIVDLTQTTGGTRYNPTRNRLPSRFSPYENDPLDITFTIPTSQGASEVLAFVGLFRTDTRLVTLLDRKPFGVGTHTIQWDGLLPDGTFAVPPPGDTFLFGIWGYRLPDNAIYLSAAPRISNFSVQPTLYSPARDGSRPLSIGFDLDKDAVMELKVVNLATGGVVFSDQFPGFFSGTGKTLSWSGLNGEGHLPDKGDYRLALTAVDASGGRSLTRYMLLRVFY